MAEKLEHPAGDVLALSDGQIALTAHNNGDGTWSVKAGPGGPILEDGLPRERALAIVGAPSYPYEPLNRREAEEADSREDLVESLREHANAEAMKSDKDLGLVDEKGRKAFPDEVEPLRLGRAGSNVAASRRAAANTENAKEKNGQA